MRHIGWPQKPAHHGGSAGSRHECRSDRKTSLGSVVISRNTLRYNLIH